jgi:hypothetical protein
MRRRLWLLLLAAVVILTLLLYPSTSCHVTQADLEMSSLRALIVPVEQGYAVGFSFNVTNHAKCDVRAQKISVFLRSVLYPDGRQVTYNSEETGTVAGTIRPGDVGSFSYMLDSNFDFRPAKLLLKIEMTFTEVGSVPVFDGQLLVSA